MTNHRALTFSFLSVAAVFITAPAAAQSDCQPGDLFCAELHIGPGQGTLRIGPGPVYEPAPPPPLVVEPEPPLVYVQPAQPEPEPPQVYVQPPQQQYYVQQPQYQPQYQQQYYMEQPQPQRRGRQWEMPESSIGIHIDGGAIFGDNLAMAGGSASLRLRPIQWIAVDVGAGVWGGSDYNGLDRVTVPVTVDMLVFFNPQHRFQFYGVVGVGGSYGHAEGFNVHTGIADNREYFHLGGEAGIGAEWRITPNFALNIDARGFIQQRVDDNAEPEFRELDNDGRTWLTTDTSGGLVARGGATFYFD